MPRPIWKGSISFGLVNIPVGLYPAEKQDELSFSLLDSKDLSRIRYRKVNEDTGEEVPSDRIVRGFEYQPGQYVVVTDEDLRRANPEATKSVEIVDFVDAEEVSPEYYDKPYYLAPIGRGGNKGYALLRETLKRTGKVAVAKVVIRTKEHLAALIPRGNVLVLELLRFPQEIRPTSDLEVPDENVESLGLSDREVEMAERLVEGMVTSWEPSRYRNEYVQDVLALIERKAEAGDLGEAPEPAAEREPRGEVVDLMPLLKRSLEQAEAKKEPARKTKAKPRAKKAA
jgi:DNA end-binding protein Ku